MSAKVEDAGGAAVTFVRTGEVSAPQEVLYALSPVDADGSESPMFGKLVIPPGASSITIPVAALPAPPGGSGASLKVIGNGDDYIVATGYSVRF